MASVLCINMNDVNIIVQYVVICLTIHYQQSFQNESCCIEAAFGSSAYQWNVNFYLSEMTATVLVHIKPGNN